MSSVLNHRFISESSFTSTESKELQLDILGFLNFIHKLGVDIVPITWQSARQPIGWGATSQINEAHISITTSFAFKCASDAQKQRGLSKVLEALMNEIGVLAQPSIRNHPNVVDLQGICWDVESEHEIWPVLILGKSEFGNLHDFVSLPNGRALSTEQRLELCVDIGTAIQDMHNTNIVHGDIKPENVLIFRDPSELGEYIAKVSDFGYSARLLSADDTCLMSRSLPWHAPEHSFDLVGLVQAQKMDVFSFALLCFWVLFEKYLAVEAMFPVEAQWAEEYFPAYKDEHLSKRFLENLKNSNMTSALARELVAADEFLDAGTKQALIHFFTVGLAPEPNSRSQDLGGLLNDLVSRRSARHKSTDATTLHTPEYDYELAVELVDNMSSLYASDYRVRKYLRHCLQERMERNSGSTERQKLAFQLAVCNEIGFGALRDVLLAEKLLQQSGRTRDELQKTLIRVMTSSDSRTGSSNWSILRKLGHVKMINFADQFHQIDELRLAEEEYKREMADIEQSLGKSNGLWMFHSQTLTLIYNKLGQWQNAARILEEALKSATSSGDDEISILQMNLAQMYRHESRLTEAERLLADTLSLLSESYAENDLRVLECKINLALVLKDQNRLQDAVDLLLKALPVIQGMLGRENPTALSTLSNLGSIYFLQSRWSQAEIIHMETKDTCERVLGAYHPFTILSVKNLANLYARGGRFNEAEEMLCACLSRGKRALGEQNPIVLDTFEELANTYISQDRLGEAEAMLSRIVKVRRDVLGPEHPDTIIGMHRLGVCYQRSGRWREAKEMYIQALELSISHFGPKHRSTLHKCLDLASLYMERGYATKAEHLMLEVMRGEEELHDRDESLRIDTLAKLVTVYRQQERLDEAEQAAVQAIGAQSRLHGYHHSLALESKNNLGAILRDQRKYTEAKTVFLEVIGIKELHGVRDAAYLVSKYCLVTVYIAEELWDDAFNLGMEVLGVTEVKFGTHHRLWLLTMEEVIIACTSLERWTDIAELEQQVLKIDDHVWTEDYTNILRVTKSIISALVVQEKWTHAARVSEQVVCNLQRVLGTEDTDTLEYMRLLSWIYTKDGRWSEAEIVMLEVVAKWKLLMGEEHEKTLSHMADLASIYSGQGRNDEVKLLVDHIAGMRQKFIGGAS
ncbi:hypothetical protein P153DRAFT_306501 [Dothidotthia symphoricarpi CBS 119687]|uniref:Protein kinase domain-containing protein n=1 Tax=Dothidotthia symphoricarpi CBS 119687 TaxID=1392245 RepID=A0A6A6APF2_9PLEO|nr:uncharacterized protein P153DRAFT_306501 [Dothidotthia symphoricarpi CBS 119687]KAF2133872.1 hypothetical protein P153DRAFT_306501 [Dothidotthia symphoricarpi CBS 119687]